MSERLRLSTRHEEGAHVVVVHGEVDMESSPRLLQEIHQHVARGSRTVVDLAGVQYIDSAGIAVLVQGLKAARKRGQEFALRAPSTQVAAVLELAQLRQLFRIEPPPGERG
jgi:anti-sigma B factor antagonist